MFEKILTVFAVLSLAGKFMFVPEAEIFFILSLSFLMLVYFPLGFFLFREKGTNTNKIKISLTNGLSLFLTLSGILFTLMFWPSGKFNLQCGIIFASVVTLFLQLRKSQTEKNTPLYLYYKGMILRNVVMITIAAVLYFVPTNTLIRFELRNNPKLAEMIIDCREKNGAGNCLREIQSYRENQILNELDKQH